MQIDAERKGRQGSIVRHWHPQLQNYVPGHVLLEYIQTGWKLDDRVEVARFYFGDHRHVDVYHFTLKHDEDQVNIPVLANPAVLKIVEEYKLTTTRTNVDNEHSPKD